jgi:hypothetical protein
MPVIRIDDEVWKWLQQRARPFVDSPNDVLRRVLQLSEPLSPQVQGDLGGKAMESRKTERLIFQEGGHAMRNIGQPARDWFRGELTNPNSRISVFLVQHGVYDRGFGFLKRYVASSKYFQAGESYPGIPVWWLQISLSQISEPNDPFPFKLLVCQKEPGNALDFWCLVAPFEYLNSEYHNGNLGTLGNNICLHLSAENCIYRGYTVKMFDDVRLTMLAGHRPTPFGQFLL